MGLLVSFFVMLVAFSTQDQVKLQVVAGSMREAFGVQDKVRYSGIIEMLVCRQGPSSRAPPISILRKPLRRRRPTKPIISALTVRDSRKTANSRSPPPRCGKPCRKCGNHRSLEAHHARGDQAGLNIEIVDQDGRSMFADGAKEPYERTRQLIQKIAPALKAMPYASPLPATPPPARRRTSRAMERGNFPRPRQCGAPDSGQRRCSEQPHLYGGRQGRYRSAVPDNPSMSPNAG